MKRRSALSVQVLGEPRVFHTSRVCGAAPGSWTWQLMKSTKAGVDGMAQGDHPRQVKVASTQSGKHPLPRDFRRGGPGKMDGAGGVIGGGVREQSRGRQGGGLRMGIQMAERGPLMNTKF